MLLQLTFPRPNAVTRASIKAFLAGYLDSYQDDVTLIYSEPEKDVWFVFIFIQNEKIDYRKFQQAFVKINNELDAAGMLINVEAMDGLISGHFWNEAARKACCDSLHKYSNWKQDTLEGITTQIKKEIAEGNDKTV